VDRSASSRRPLRRLLLPVLVAAVLLASCTCDGTLRVTSLGLRDGTLYAGVEDGFEGSLHTYASRDLGRTWQRVEGEPPEAATEPCGADGTCFRVVDTDIERSTAAGGWRRVWSIPVERTDFVRARGDAFLSCGSGGIDMAFTTEAVAVRGPAGTTAVVGMGDQGVVIVDGDEVLRVGVTYLEPTPFTSGFSGYRLEALLAVAGALALFWLLSAVAVVVTQPARRDGRGKLAVVLGAVVPAVVFVLSLGTLVFAAALVLVFPVALVAAWSGVAAATPHRVGRLFGSALVGSVAALVVALAPFELWARGVFDSHRFAVNLAVPLGLVAVVWLVYRQRASAVEAVATAGEEAALSARRDPLIFDG
jgi:hypothetical protein